MKNYLKTIPVILGLILASLGSVNEVKASNSSENAAFGYCAPSSSGCCYRTSDGICMGGRWVEGPDEWIER